MKYIFLGKEKNSNDRDIVKYIEIRGFECNHYFSGLHITGACFSGFDEETRKNYKNLETILTENDFNKLFELNDKLKELGYGIVVNDERYQKGIKILEEMNKIVDKLKSDENKKLFNKVIVEEKEYLKNEYCLTDDDIEKIFDNYRLDYQDRAIVSAIYNDFDDMVENEKWSFGYENIPYFDDNAFGQDLLNSDDYLELPSGKIVYYSY